MKYNKDLEPIATIWNIEYEVESEIHTRTDYFLCKNTYIWSDKYEAIMENGRLMTTWITRTLRCEDDDLRIFDYSSLNEDGSESFYYYIEEISKDDPLYKNTYPLSHEKVLLKAGYKKDPSCDFEIFYSEKEYYLSRGSLEEEYRYLLENHK